MQKRDRVRRKCQPWQPGGPGRPPNDVVAHMEAQVVCYALDSYHDPSDKLYETLNLLRGLIKTFEEPISIDKVIYKLRRRFNYLEHNHIQLAIGILVWRGELFVATPDEPEPPKES